MASNAGQAKQAKVFKPKISSQIIEWQLHMLRMRNVCISRRKSQGESVSEPEIVPEATAGGNRKPTCCSRGAKCIWQHCQHGQHLNKLEGGEGAGRQAGSSQAAS